MNRRTWVKYSDEEISSWPPDHKRCRVCQEVLPFIDFHKQRQTLFGYMTECKDCRKPKSKSVYWSTSMEKLLYQRARSRAVKKDLDFNIDLKDIVIPERCPVFDVPLERGTGRFSPSLDRIDSSKGYIKGNVCVISTWANTLKGDSTPNEIEALYKYVCK